ncbi:hypothetical protein SARC_07535 [Sphaeroforma arctica JP610]|uniref:Uncharacterized protein n=1 Tax=Sphaeroforma arctica JP610 TaxID=667725 RepID=A0A0L0FTI1_9EUKA|nr:hypothetical protein SARC_07535 [Sphaeroforma arctica JP610]KNC80092.1 hypothetical protein SARC_07535 [Sphaeroforma arctica JP610]|eukprot:XP_014153994.1 hypothetical protein SARC_07535 [Sphaeroforma arctica JP610]
MCASTIPTLTAKEANNSTKPPVNQVEEALPLTHPHGPHAILYLDDIVLPDTYSNAASESGESTSDNAALISEDETSLAHREPHCSIIT